VPESRELSTRTSIKLSDTLNKIEFRIESVRCV
jgi:hypothetical protein